MFQGSMFNCGDQLKICVLNIFFLPLRFVKPSVDMTFVILYAAQHVITFVKL